ncbi:diuretic hormone receptor-like [Rhagoletis pomonella]|uniref:diuretic hormone receptor-like n=1 Tax=Rhagoletis pomonella TaxID=28610 RepID=UPI0017819973|nr:diuretic hormone receptor-like [Rhagoletis pomonella]
MSISDVRAVVVESLDDATALDFTDIIANFSTETLAMVSDILASPPSAANDIYINRTVKEHCMRLLQTYNLQKKQEEVEQHHLLTGDTNYYALRHPTDRIVANLTCPPFFDTVLCWPATAAATTAKQPCFAEFKGVLYNTTENVTRHCSANGVWDNYSDYMKCQPSIFFADISPTVELSSYIYFVGYFLSLASLILALIVFYFFKDLKCLRNTIHANLFLTYILAALLWILTMCLHVMTEHPSEAGCIILVMMFHYFNLTNFFWMFVEGLYLYTLVVQTFSRDNIRFGIYTAIGWGCPAVITFIWSIAKIFATSLETEHFNGVSYV